MISNFNDYRWRKMILRSEEEEVAALLPDMAATVDPDTVVIPEMAEVQQQE